jgi:hypothetical protein
MLAAFTRVTEGEDGVMPGEGDATARQPVNGRRAFRSDLRRLEPVEGGDQDTQPGNMALRSHDEQGIRV